MDYQSRRVAVKDHLAELHQQRSDPLVKLVRDTVEHYKQMAAHDAATKDGTAIYKAQGVYEVMDKFLEGLDRPPHKIV